MTGLAHHMGIGSLGPVAPYESSIGIAVTGILRNIGTPIPSVYGGF